MALEDLMLQPIVNPELKFNIGSGNQNNQFSELMDEINYAKRLLISKKWNRAQYYNHMADFHDYINDPAPNLRILADKWLQEHSG